MAEDKRTVFTVRDGASFLEQHGIQPISEARVYQMVRDGQLDAVRVGRRIYIKRQSLEEMCGLEVAA